MRMLTSIVLFSTALAYAGSLPFSRSGVLDSPDAYILSHTEIEACIAGSAYSVSDPAGSKDSEFKITGHVDVGLFRYGQVGVSWLADGGLAGNVKVGILSEGISVPAFAVGLENITGEKNIECFEDADGDLYDYSHAQNMSAYGVLSKDMESLIGVPATVSIGIGTGRFVGMIDNGAAGIGSRIANGFFCSVVYRPAGNFSLTFEEDGRDLNFGASYQVSRLFTINITWAELEMSLFPPDRVDRMDIMQNSKFGVSLESRFGPVIGARNLELEREQMRIERARQRLRELEERRRAAENELQRLRELIEGN